MGIYDWSIDEDAQKSGDGRGNISVGSCGYRYKVVSTTKVTIDCVLGHESQGVRDAVTFFPRLVTDEVVGVAVSLAFNYMVEKT